MKYAKSFDINYRSVCKTKQQKENISVIHLKS